MTLTLVDKLAKAELKAKEYARGPVGVRPFVIGIQDEKDQPGVFRTWEGKADVAVHPDRKEHQAVLNVNEHGREVTRKVLLRDYSDPRDKSVTDIHTLAQANFPVNMGRRAGLKWDYGEIDIKKVRERLKYHDPRNRWDLTIPVTCIAPTTSQSLLVGMDETHYFVAALPENVETVKEAHAVLKPVTADRPGTLRQGEWFFVPVSDRLARALLKRIKVLSSMRLERNSSHEAPIIEHGNHKYAIGEVIDNRKGRHAPLLLTSFHQVIRNREVTVINANEVHQVQQRRTWD